MIPLRHQLLAAIVVWIGAGIWFQAKAELNFSKRGVALRRRPRSGRGIAPPWGRQYYTPLGWWYRRIAFVFEGLALSTFFIWQFVVHRWPV